MAETLHIGNIGSETTDQHLHDLFARSGRVVSARVVTDPVTQQSRGFGLVEMAMPEDAESARRTIHGTLLAGRLLTVRAQQPRANGWAGKNDQGGSNRSHGFGPGNGGSRW